LFGAGVEDRLAFLKAIIERSKSPSEKFGFMTKRLQLRAV
jgi:hypothetical protein